VKGSSLGLSTCDINFQWKGESVSWNHCCFFKTALGGDGWEWRKDGIMPKASIFGICVVCVPSVFCKWRMLFLLGVVFMAITNFNCFILRCYKNACDGHDFARIFVLIHDFGNVNKSSKTKKLKIFKWLEVKYDVIIAAKVLFLFVRSYQGTYNDQYLSLGLQRIWFANKFVLNFLLEFVLHCASIVNEV
jgi:hypothetical protein